MLAKHALSQLSYGPQANAEHLLVTRQHVREANVRKRKAQRDQRTQQEWWAWEDLNLRPHAYQARALTN